MAKYQIFEGTNRQTGAKTITVVSRYAGKTVRGIAKCNPEKDEYDLPNGIALAQARCDVKVCEKRLANAKRKQEVARKAVEEAQKYLQKMTEYVADASADCETVSANLVALEEEMRK